MRPSLVLAAAALAIGGAPAAALVLVGAGAVHVARSPDRLFDALYAAAFILIGVVAGRP